MSFQQDAYTVTEASGAATVCVTLAGSIVRNVSTTLFTMDVDAVGRSWNSAYQRTCIPVAIILKENQTLCTGYSVVDLGGVKGVQMHPPLAASNVLLHT